jgi:UPF0271 protein
VEEGLAEAAMAALVYVLDTTALIARWLLYAPTRGFTTSLVAAEARDQASREGLETALQLGRLEIRDPSPRFLAEARRQAARLGLHSSLSEADLSVAALALELRSQGNEVVVVTDDYALQNLVASLGMRFQPLRTKGIRETRDYVVRCPACGYVSTRPGERVCPVCGTPLRRYRRRRSRATK